MQNFGYLLLSLACVLAATFVRPDRGRCPPHFWINGIRPSGLFSCLRTPIVESDSPADAELDGELWCGVNAMPTVIDERDVRCARGGVR